MNFRISDPSTIDRDRFPLTLRQWESEGGRWWIHLNAVLYGARCMVGRRDDPYGYEAGYCCGDDMVAQVLVPALMARALAGVPEDAAPADVAAALPPQTVKPIGRDRACWLALCAAAGYAGVEPAGGPS